MNITPETKEKLKTTGKEVGVVTIGIAIALGVLRLFGFKVDVSHVSQKRR